MQSAQFSRVILDDCGGPPVSGAETAAKRATSGDPAESAVARADARSDRRKWLPWWTGLAGFFLGVLFWHFVGFWSFVSEVAFNGDEAKSPSRLINLDAARSVGASARATGTARPLPNVSGKDADAESAESAGSDVLDDLLQCSEARRPAGNGDTDVLACPPLRRRLPSGRQAAARADRQMDAREAAERLANGWETGVSRIETGSLR